MSYATTDTSNSDIALKTNYTRSGICLNNYVDENGLKAFLNNIRREIPFIQFNCKLKPTVDKSDNVLKIPLPFTIDDKVSFISIEKDKMRQLIAWSFDAEDQLEDPQLDTRIYYEHLGVYC